MPFFIHLFGLGDDRVASFRGAGKRAEQQQWYFKEEFEPVEIQVRQVFRRHSLFDFDNLAEPRFAADIVGEVVFVYDRQSSYNCEPDIGVEVNTSG